MFRLPLTASKRKSIEYGIDKQGVRNILERAGLGMPDYYKWRSRSGCTFCFYQQKIEWVRLKENHPDKYDEAKSYEKLAQDHDSPFTWSMSESLADMEKPERVKKIKEDYELRKAKWKANKAKRDLLAWAKEDRHYEQEDEIDEIYGDQIGHACIICHK